MWKTCKIQVFQKCWHFCQYSSNLTACMISAIFSFWGRCKNVCCQQQDGSFYWQMSSRPSRHRVPQKCESDILSPYAPTRSSPLIWEWNICWKKNTGKFLCRRQLLSQRIKLSRNWTFYRHSQGSCYIELTELYNNNQLFHRSRVP